MNILILGAHGLLGQALLSRPWPDVTYLCPRSAQLDVLRPETWGIWLRQADMVVNLIGTMNADANRVWAVQYHGLQALLSQAWAYGRLRYVLNVSAWGADVKSKTAFLSSKACLDEAVLCHGSMGVLRPSLVFTPDGNSSRMLLAQAKKSLCFLPQAAWRRVLQPVGLYDVSMAMVAMLQQQHSGCIAALGAECLSLAEYVQAMRQHYWQRAAAIHVPIADKWVMRVLPIYGYWAAADWLQADTVRMLQETEAGDNRQFVQLLQRQPASSLQFLQDAADERI